MKEEGGKERESNKEGANFSCSNRQTIGTHQFGHSFLGLIFLYLHDNQTLSSEVRGFLLNNNGSIGPLEAKEMDS